MMHVLIVTNISLTDDFSLHTADVIGHNQYAMFGTISDKEIVYRLFANEDTIFDKKIDDEEFDAILYVLEKDEWPREHILERLFKLKTNNVLCNSAFSDNDYAYKYCYSDLSHEWNTYQVTKKVSQDA